MKRDGRGVHDSEAAGSPAARSAAPAPDALAPDAPATQVPDAPVPGAPAAPCASSATSVSAIYPEPGGSSVPTASGEPAEFPVPATVVSGEVLLAAAPVVSCTDAVGLLDRAIAQPVGAARLALLVGVQVCRLNDADRLRYLSLWQETLNWVQAHHYRAVAAAAGPARVADAQLPPEAQASSVSGSLAEDSRLAEIAATLRVTPLGVARLAAAARDAVTKAEPVLQRMLTGAWSQTHLRRALEAVELHDAKLARAAVTAAVHRGALASPSSLKRRIGQELVARDSVAATARIKAKRRQREVALWARDDLVGELTIVGSWTKLNTTYRHLSRRAEQVLDALRNYRRTHPHATFCCPSAITTALTNIDQHHPDLTGHRSDSGDLRHGPSDHNGHGGRGGSDTTGGRARCTHAACSTSVVTSTGGSAAAYGVNAVTGAGNPSDPGPVAGLFVVLPCPACGSTSRDLPTLDQLRADALVEAGALLASQMQADTGVGTEELTARRGARWRHAVVVADLATTMGLAEVPGWVPGYGYVPADIARELLAEATSWQRFLLDGHGRVAGIGATTYRPSNGLRDLVTARDLVCTFPGCERTAATADLDHRNNFDGSNTTASNLHPLCRTHHRLKTHTGWTVRRDSDGTDHWHAPDGTEYLEHPPQPPWPTAPAQSPWASPPDGVAPYANAAPPDGVAPYANAHPAPGPARQAPDPSVPHSAEAPGPPVPHSAEAPDPPVPHSAEAPDPRVPHSAEAPGTTAWATNTRTDNRGRTNPTRIRAQAP